MNVSVDTPDHTQKTVPGIFNIKSTLLALWRKRFLLLSCGLLPTLIAMLYGMIAKPVYVSTSILAPVNLEYELGGQLGKVSGQQLGGLARLAGLSLGSGGDQVTEAISLMSSQDFALRISEKHNFQQSWFIKRWNSKTRSWKINEGGVVNSIKTIFPVYNESKRDSQRPTRDEIHTAYRKHSKIMLNDTSGLVTVEGHARTPNEAKILTESIIFDINRSMRAQAINQARASRQYLESQLKVAQASELRNAMSDIIQLQLRRETLAYTTPNYVFRVIDPATLPQKATSPRPFVLMAVAFALGLFFGALLIIWRDV
jgi:uncharacterized protein involved in exopolysaccharide biosynthesis